MGFLIRWRWPRIGSEDGLGGRCSLRRVIVWSKSLKAKRRIRRERDEYSSNINMCPIFFWQKGDDYVFFFFFIIEGDDYVVYIEDYRVLHACNYMSMVRAHLCLFCSVKVMIMLYIYSTRKNES